MQTPIALTALCLLLALAACGRTEQARAEQPPPPLSAEAQAAMLQINTAAFAEPFPADATPQPGAAYDPRIVRVEALLDRAHFSPGVIDGHPGENLANAIRAYRAAHGLAAAATIDEALVQALTADDSSEALMAYVTTREDVSGPFSATPATLEAMSRKRRLSYQSAVEALAEKFHMDEDLLRALNPNTRFDRAGTAILVARPGGDLAGMVARLEVDRTAKSVTAFNAAGAIVAHYPATIGSDEAPAPTGDYAVRSVAFDPTYHYDPERLPSFGARHHGALTIAAGPNNPVGAVWIALTLDTYGIHGTPNPAQIGKTESHGCVRLTNWDAVELAHAVQQGTPVMFLNAMQAQADIPPA